MPIRKERKHLYPANWKTEIVPAVRMRSGNRCERCRVHNHEKGGRGPDGTFYPAHLVIQRVGNSAIHLTKPKAGEWHFCRGYFLRPRIIRIVLTVAHLNHDETDNRLENLAHLCQRCHNRHDAKHRAEGRRARKQAQGIAP